ncbi:MAG: hypothetical protein ACKUBY_03525 [Candidatus Moraniibacteriota bacterium]|jgi:hypothetical protein
MTTTERLKQHIEDLEKRKIALFFNVQNTAATINGRVYNYYIIISLASLFVLLAGQLTTGRDSFLIFWSGLFAFTALVISLAQYLFALDKISGKLYKNICSIYKGYDDEFYLLKKFNTGDIEEDIIRQFYVNKSKELERYECHVATPNWFIWVNISLLAGAIILLMLA